MPFENFLTRTFSHCDRPTRSRSRGARSRIAADSRPDMRPKIDRVWRAVRYPGNRCPSGR